MEAKTISALMVAPGEHPVAVNLCCCKPFLDLAVSFGVGEACEATFMHLADDVGVLYNREAPLWKLRGNRKLGSRILAGVFYIVGVEAGKLVSLPEKRMAQYELLLYEPEHYTAEEVDDSFFRSWIDEIESLASCGEL